MYYDQDGVAVNPPRAYRNYDVDVVSQQTGLKCTEPSLAQQQFKDECDINVILERFGVTGHLPITTKQPMQGDFTNVVDYQTAVEAVRDAEKNFMTLPWKVRDKFGQDPRQFVDFCLNPANIDAVREMGLAPKPAAVPVPTEKPNGGS